MSFEPKDEADLLKHPLFIKWISGSSVELDDYWNNWLKKNPEKKVFLIRAKDLAESLSWKEQHRMPTEDFSRIKDNLMLYHAKQAQYQIGRAHV